MKQETANFECGATQKRANPVDLEKCCKSGVKKIGFYTVENGTSNVAKIRTLFRIPSADSPRTSFLKQGSWGFIVIWCMMIWSHLWVEVQKRKQVLGAHAERDGAKFNQRPFFRLFLCMLMDMNTSRLQFLNEDPQFVRYLLQSHPDTWAAFQICRQLIGFCVAMQRNDGNDEISV